MSYSGTRNWLVESAVCLMMEETFYGLNKKNNQN